MWELILPVHLLLLLQVSKPGRPSTLVMRLVTNLPTQIVAAAGTRLMGIIFCAFLHAGMMAMGVYTIVHQACHYKHSNHEKCIDGLLGRHFLFFFVVFCLGNVPTKKFLISNTKTS